jgi:predicted protein tyrosine phosphatase
MPDKRLIEVAFPLKQTSLDSVHEKNVRHGHISTLHIYRRSNRLSVGSKWAFEEKGRVQIGDIDISENEWSVPATSAINTGSISSMTVGPHIPS